MSFTLGSTWGRLPEYMSQRDTLQRSYGNNKRMESQQAFQTPGKTGRQDKGESSQYPRHRIKIEPERAYPDSFSLTRSKPNRFSSSFTPFRNQKIRDQ
ncbi:hypothetical protein O181_104751 [Austropuccinia psidii MF-1]|uniref:Uncharacterized protein n=1 Tax=Austropuccinia psidii MF-1 TaxID=1389203 RepID=A0A9Q3JMU3_9BASI|nr:hypothetical protein [Austropuccinia psidii MF-1]